MKVFYWLVSTSGSAFARHTNKVEIKHYSRRYKGSSIVQAALRADAELKFKKRAVR